MKRAAYLLLLLAVLVPAGFALNAQEKGDSENIDDLIESLRARLEASAAGPKKALAFELRIYDVRDLVHRVVDYPGERMNLTPSGGFGFGFDEAEEGDALPFYEGDMIVDMIFENVAPGSWRELRSARMDYVEKGFIMVRHTAAVHERIEQMLDALRMRAAAQITLDVRVLRMTDARLRAVMGGKSGAVLDDASKGRLDAAIGAGEAEVVGGGSITCTNTQRVSLSDTARVSYVQDYDVEIAQGASIPDPIVMGFPEGLTVDVRPVIAGDGDLVVLEVLADAAKARTPIEILTTPLGRIETPALDILKLRTTIAAPLGRTVVVGGGFMDGDGKGYLLVLTPTATWPRPRPR